MSGSTRKLHKQKGTGGARKGDINSPTMVGGGRAFGPRPRTYGQKLNKKIKLLAKKSVLSDKAKTSKIFILEDFTFDTPKTKEFVGILKNMSLLGNKNIIVTGDLNRNVYLSGRNVPFQDITSVESLNTYQILKAKNVLLFESAFDKFYRLPNSKPGGSGLGLSIAKGFVEAHGGKITSVSYTHLTLPTNSLV